MSSARPSRPRSRNTARSVGYARAHRPLRSTLTIGGCAIARDFAALVAAQQARLKAIYARADPPDVKRMEKAQAFDAMRADYAALKAQWGGIVGIRCLVRGPLNNATLAAVATYRRWVPGLRAHLEAVGLDEFYADTAALAKVSAAERTARLTAWLVAASPISLAPPESG